MITVIVGSIRKNSPKQGAIQQTNQSTTVVIDEPIEKWEACRNEVVGYEVRYPNGWNTYSRMGALGNPVSCDTRDPEFVISPEDGLHINKVFLGVEYRDTSPNLGYVYSGASSLEEYLTKLPFGSGEIFKETLVHGKRAMWIKSNGSTAVLTYNNNKVFIISEKNVSDQTFDSFLSTFKFLK